jgi:hypothetical protein
MSSDIAIGVTTKINGAAPLLKPPYLITLGSKSAKIYFISLDKPELLNGFIQVKGIYTSGLEDDIIANYAEILAQTNKDLYVEIMFPWHTILSMRSLIFKAK